MPLLLNSILLRVYTVGGRGGGGGGLARGGKYDNTQNRMYRAMRTELERDYDAQLF